MSFYDCEFSPQCNSNLRSRWPRWRSFYLCRHDVRLAGQLQNASHWQCMSTASKSQRWASGHDKHFLHPRPEYHPNFFLLLRRVSVQRKRCNTALWTRLHQTGQINIHQIIPTRDARSRLLRCGSSFQSLCQTIRTLHSNDIIALQLIIELFVMLQLTLYCPRFMAVKSHQIFPSVTNAFFADVGGHWGGWHASMNPPLIEGIFVYWRQFKAIDYWHITRNWKDQEDEKRQSCRHGCEH